MCRAADRLQQLRTALNLTPYQFATSMGLPLRRASCLLQPRRAPSRQLVARVLRAFPQVAPIWLLTGEGDIFLPAPTGGNYLAVNYGYNVQLITQSCNCGCTIGLLQEHLRDKERTIQLLINKLPSS